MDELGADLMVDNEPESICRGRLPLTRGVGHPLTSAVTFKNATMRFFMNDAKPKDDLSLSEPLCHSSDSQLIRSPGSFIPDGPTAPSASTCYKRLVSFLVMARNAHSCFVRVAGPYITAAKKTRSRTGRDTRMIARS